jgi:hypothetical protein
MDWDQKESALQYFQRRVIVLSSGKVDIYLIYRIEPVSHYEEVKYDMNHEGTKGRLLVSHLMLRRVLGILGIALPVVLALWGFALSGWSMELQDSISDYYSLRTRDAFVGILFVIAWFLFAYRGYERKDDVAGYLACVFALGVAFFPNSGEGWEKIVHFSSAAGLFLVLSFFSLFLFTKSGDSRTPQKRMRNRVYVACGLAMLACMVLIGLYYLFLKDTAVSDIKPVFWLESLMIWAFGISWFVKGETLLKDPKA